jgi:hypothetical protein
MPRPKGSATTGPTRSTRLPGPLDEWFQQRLDARRELSPSELLVALIHGGLRLRDGYMAIHRRTLEDFIAAGRTADYEAYVRCLLDTFGRDYVEHLRRWLEADGYALPAPAPNTASERGEAL